MRLRVSTEPDEEPVSLTTAKAFLKVDTTDDNALISLLIKAARQLCEEHTGRKFVTQTLTGTLDCFPQVRAGIEWWDGTRDGAITDFVGNGRVMIPTGPVSAISEVRTIADDATATVFASASYYLGKQDSGSAWIALKDGYSWPTIERRDTGGIEVDFVAGYGDASLVPSALVLAVLNTLAALYENRGAGGGIPASAMTLMASYRVVRL